MAGVFALYDDERIELLQPLPSALAASLHALRDRLLEARRRGLRELTLGDLGTREGLLGGINAVIVGNYLTTLGREPDADLELLSELKMPIRELAKTL